MVFVKLLLDIALHILLRRKKLDFRRIVKTHRHILRIRPTRREQAKPIILHAADQREELAALVFRMTFVEGVENAKDPREGL